MSHSLRPHGLQHARLPCPSPTPGACSNSCPSSQWCHPTTPSSVIPFSSCLQSFPVSGSFLMCQFFASGGQSTIGASASASVLPVNIQDWFPLGLTGLIHLVNVITGNWGLHLPLRYFFLYIMSFLFLTSYTIAFFCVKLFHYAVIFKPNGKKGLQAKNTFILSFIVILWLPLLLLVSSCGLELLSSVL